MAAGLFIIGLLVAVGSFIYSYVLNEQAQDAIANMPDADKTTLGDITRTQQSEGLVVPIVYGYGYLAGNTLWWGANKENTGEGDFYQIWVWQSIGMGDLFPVYGAISDVMKFINSRYWCFVDSKEGGSDVPHYFQRGDGNNYIYPMTGPAPYYHPVLGAMYGDGYKAKPLNGIAHVFIYAYSLPVGRTTIPTFKFKVRKILYTGLPNENMWYNDSELGFEVYIGNNPAAIIYDLLTNKQYGLGLDASVIDWDNFVIASNYFEDKKYALNFVVAASTPARNIINKIQEWVDCYLVKDALDKYQIVIFQETDINNPVATIYDKDIIDLTIRRKSWQDTFNSFTANYIPTYTIDGTFPFGLRYSDKEVRTMTAKNLSSIQLTGGKKEKVVDLTGLGEKHAVAHRLHQIMKKESYPFSNGTLKLNLAFSYLRIGNIIIIDSDEYNVVMPFRIIGIDINKIDENILEYDILQMREVYADDNFTIDDTIISRMQRAEEPPCLENLTFDPFNSISSPLSYRFINDSASIVHWGTNQLMSGLLTYGTDYTVVDHNKIQLDTTIFADEIMFNANGLMNIDVYEAGCPSVES